MSTDETWFWTDRHQASEREADADAVTGRWRDFDSAEEFLADLEHLARRSAGEETTP
jgi:hypothetical protein